MTLTVPPPCRQGLPFRFVASTFEGAPESRQPSFDCLNFLLRAQQKIGTFVPLRSGLGACCLTILIFLRVLNVLRVPCDHATPTFAGFKVIVYRMKGDSLQDERCRFTGRKVSVYRMKGDSLQETPENLRPATAKIGVFFLKVSVYRMKGDFCLYKNITCVL